MKDQLSRERKAVAYADVAVRSKQPTALPRELETAREAPNPEKLIEFIKTLRSKGRNAPKTFADIPDFPFENLDEFRSAIQDGDVLIQLFSLTYMTTVFKALATPFENHLFNSYCFLAVAFPVTSFALAFLHSWWWLVGTAGGPFFWSASKRVYSRIVFSSALGSELGFCFLYILKAIAITSTDFWHCLYWEIKETPDEDKKWLESLRVVR